MDHKNLVMKSKSSNSALTKPNAGTEPENSNKKSWSSGRVRDQHPGSCKKRGVYVEKKPYSSARAATVPPDVPKAPKRSRRGEKNFLNNCLSILSQETTATQFPDLADPAAGLEAKGNAKRGARAPAATVDKGTQDLDAIYSATSSPPPPRARPARRRAAVATAAATTTAVAVAPKQRKPRFRSRALSENFIDNNLVVLQAKKAVARTPSASSSRGSKAPPARAAPAAPTAPTVPRPQPDTNREQKQGSQDDGDIKNMLRIDDKAANDQEEIRNVQSMVSNNSKKIKKRSSVRIEEPSNTLISDYTAKNKSLYNFFVDLLETTCSVYNVETDFSHSPSATFEIDAKVAKKLTIQQPTPVNKPDDANDINVPVTNCGSPRKMYFVTDDGVTDNIAVYQASHWEPPAARARRPRPGPPGARGGGFRAGPFRRASQTYDGDYRSNLKSESFQFAQRLKLLAAAKAESFVRPNRKNCGKNYNRNNKTRDLLSLLKEELKSGENCLEEPATLHQALAMIVKNKKQTQRAIHKDDSCERCSMAERSKHDIADCFKARKIIGTPSTMGARKKKCMGRVSFMDSLKKNKLSRKYSMAVLAENEIKKTDQFYESNEPSCDSIEVKGYDYLPTQYIRRLDPDDKKQVVCCNSGISLKSETINSSKDYMDCLQKCGKSLSQSPASSHSGSTAISQLLLRDVFNMY